MGLGFIPMNIFVNPLTPLYSIVLIGIGPIFSTSLFIYFWRKGVPNAKYFAIGWIIGHITSEIDLLRTMGVIPHIFPGSTLPDSCGNDICYYIFQYCHY
jgi:7TM diverse intracellular signalling